MASLFLSSLVLKFFAALILLPQGLAAYKLTPTYKSPNSELPPSFSFEEEVAPFRNFEKELLRYFSFEVELGRFPTYKPWKKRSAPPDQKQPLMFGMTFLES